MNKQTTKKRGLILSGGGARAAYQAGVLRGIAEISGSTQCPFEIITGTSAGAINGAFLASEFQDFQQATKDLWDLWEKLDFSSVFDSGGFSLFGTGLGLIKDLGFGGLSGGSNPNHLLSTEPLRKLIENAIDFKKIRPDLDSTSLHAVALTAVNYHSGANIIFYDTNAKIEDWVRTNRFSKKQILTSDHVMASAAIPVFFPPVKIHGTFFGDGGVRQISPLSSAIHLGGERLLAIGIRHARTFETTEKLSHAPMAKVSFADISGVLLNTLFLDSLSSDLERLERINRTLSVLNAEGQAQLEDPLRQIEVMTQLPSTDLAKLAAGGFTKFPKTLRYLLKGLGASGDKGQDLLSYLTFHTSYTLQLLELGKTDAFSRKDEMEKWFV